MKQNTKQNTRSPIIAMTGPCPVGDTKKKCLAAGMDDFITKPLKQKDFFGQGAQLDHACGPTTDPFALL